MNTCRRTFRNVETGRPDATGLLNKADGKNREPENPEEISLLNGRNPTVALAIPGGALRNREFAARGEAAPSVCEHGRNDKTPKGLPHGVLRAQIRPVGQEVLDLEKYVELISLKNISRDYQ